MLETCANCGNQSWKKCAISNYCCLKHMCLYTKDGRQFKSGHLRTIENWPMIYYSMAKNIEVSESGSILQNAIASKTVPVHAVSPDADPLNEEWLAQLDVLIQKSKALYVFGKRPDQHQEIEIELAKAWGKPIYFIDQETVFPNNPVIDQIIVAVQEKSILLEELEEFRLYVSKANAVLEKINLVDENSEVMCAEAFNVAALTDEEFHWLEIYLENDKCYIFLEEPRTEEHTIKLDSALKQRLADYR